MPRGGPRPNSGPPRGNLNALKHGRTSRQYQRLLRLIAEDPEAADLILQIARAQRRRRDRAQREANRVLDSFARAVRAQAQDHALALLEKQPYDASLPRYQTAPSRRPREKTTKHQNADPRNNHDRR